MRPIQVFEEHRQIYRTANIITPIAAVLMVSLGFSDLNTIPLLGVLILSILAPTISGFFVWLNILEKSGGEPG
jgi:hypothetical protein